MIRMLVFLDIETTGFDGKKDEILEIAAVKWDGEKVVETFETLLKIPKNTEISSTVQSLTGISAEMCEQNGMEKEEAKQKLQNFLEKDDIITGHNIQFDTKFLKDHGFVFENREMDTFVLSTLVLGKNEESHALEILAEKYGIVHENAHRAMSDVLANLGLYEFLQIFAAKNFKKELMEKCKILFEKGIFTEYVFFENVEKKREILLQKPLKEAEFSFQKTLKKEKEIHLSQFSKEKTIFVEKMRYDDLFLATLESQNPIAICYGEGKKMMFLEFFRALQHTKPNRKIRTHTIPTLFDAMPEVPNLDKNIQFFVETEKNVDEKKVEKMLEKPRFSRDESVILAKFFQAKMNDQLHLLHFGQHEWATAREILGGENDYSTADIAFVPFSDRKKLPKNMQIVILDSDELEDLLTAEHTEKLFSKRLLEDFSSYKETSAFQNIEEALNTFSEAIRKEKGENQYSVVVPFKTIQNMPTILEIFLGMPPFFAKKNFENLSADLEKTLERWQQFFSETEVENVLKSIELFSDNAFAIQKTPKDLQPFAEEIFATPAIFMGKAFAKDAKNIPVFSFNLPEKFDWSPEEKSVAVSILVPKNPREISAEEAAKLVENWILEGENVVVSCPTKKTWESMVEILRPVLEQKNVSCFTANAGSPGKIRMRLSQKGQKLVVGNAKFLEGLSLEDFHFDTMFVVKAAFDAQKNPLLSERRKKFVNDFEDFALPRAKARFEREIFRLKNPKKLVFGDGRSGQKNSYYRVFFADIHAKIEILS